MQVLDADERRKGQPDLSRGSGFLPGAPLVLSHTYLISHNIYSLCSYREGEGGEGGGGGGGGGGMELHNILDNNSGKKGRFKRCTENFFTLNMFTGRFFIPKFRKRKIWKSFDSLKSMGGNVEIISIP